ncbi:hypothetical protein [Streptomyces sp. CAU 1734]|uniref:hypothetical protein n=1 Tax=Streptomyces sp. CAU 1734 TaxID=3140360 RepID=UPI0032615AEF
MFHDAEHDSAQYGYGISRHDDGVLVHIAAGAWSVRYWPGNPDSLRTEERTGYWIASVWGRCGRGLTWKSGPPESGGPRPCPACGFSRAELAGRRTRVRPTRPR